MELLVVALLVACNAGNGESADEVTYYKDIEPIVTRSCIQCHKDGGTGPFPLDSYDAVYKVKDLSKDKVSTRTMPPWFTSKECGEYENDISLTDEEIAMYEKWVDQGAPEGDPADLPPDTGDQPRGGPPRLEHVDLSLAMPEAYTPTLADEVHCYNMVWPMKETTFITGINIRIGDESIMHHITLHLIDPEHAAEYIKEEAADPDVGYVCADSTGAFDEGTEEIGGWLGGSTITQYPDGTGHQIDPGSIVQLQIHYTPPAGVLGVASDLTSLQFSTADDVVQAYLEIVADINMVNMDVMLPANDPDVLLTGNVPAPSEPDTFYVTGGGFHMHYLGTGGGVWIQHPDGTKDCILDLTGWDPNWQQAYDLVNPLLFQPGDKWYIECAWDNSQENQPIIDGEQRLTRDIPWGTALEDEMCRSSVHMTSIPQDQ